MRITVACPEALRDDANHFAMVMAFGPDDARTYGAPGWQDAEGNLYAAASFEARREWVLAALANPARPAWDVKPYIVNMTGAERAQAALVFWTLGSPSPPPQAIPGALTAIGGMDGLEALAAMGLTRVQA